MNNMFGVFKVSLLRAFIGVFILFISTQSFAQKTDPWECNEKLFDEILRSWKTNNIYSNAANSAVADLNRLCPELGESIGSMGFVRENTIYARLGAICFASEGDDLKKLKNGSMKHSEYYAFNKASATCKSFLIKEWGLQSSVEIETKQREKQSAVTRPQQSTQSQSSSQPQQQSQQSQQRSSNAEELATSNRMIGSQKQSAQETQQKADQARKGKRRQHEPENEASRCIQPDFGGLYGGMKNVCNFKVSYTFCGYRPSDKSWLTGMNCEKQSFGSDTVSPGNTQASHTHGVQHLYWFACREPALPIDQEFVAGSGVRGRCYTVGGN